MPEAVSTFLTTHDVNQMVAVQKAIIDEYHALKLGDYNIGRNGPLLTIPFYMAFLLTEV